MGPLTMLFIQPKKKKKKNLHPIQRVSINQKRKMMIYMSYVILVSEYLHLVTKLWIPNVKTITFLFGHPTRNVHTMPVMLSKELKLKICSTWASRPNLLHLVTKQSIRNIQMEKETQIIYITVNLMSVHNWAWSARKTTTISLFSWKNSFVST